jgi:FkbM family methyltransferase
MIRYFIRRIIVAISTNSQLSSIFGIKYFGLDKIDKSMSKLLTHKNGFYVELGANDGVTYSNTLFLERHLNWKGVLIEPSPLLFERLQKSRGRNNFLSNSACVSFKYEQPTVVLLFSDLMTTALNIESDILFPYDHVASGQKFWRGSAYKFLAPASTLQGILDTAEAPKHIDFLSLDVEGVELEVLQGVNHDEYRFRYICIESRNFEKINVYLTRNNYEYVSKLSDHDYLFIDMKPTDTSNSSVNKLSST